MSRFSRLILMMTFWFVFTGRDSQAQGVKSRSKGVDCATLCADLEAAIRQRPETLVMRLEDALVINDHCAEEIVITAILAVDARPALVDQIVKTAVKVVPARAQGIQQAARSYSPKKAEEFLLSAVPKAELAAVPPVKSEGAAKEEIRRAETPGSKGSVPIVEIRRAVSMENHASMASAGTTVEIRRAEPAKAQAQTQSQSNQPASAIKESEVRRAIQITPQVLSSPQPLPRR